MILLDTTPSSGSRSAVAIFGVGLIGFAVAEALRRRRAEDRTTLPLDWYDRSLRSDQLQTIEVALSGLLQSGTPLKILWSAGRAGFLSNAAETEEELHLFQEVFAMIRGLTRAHEVVRTSFHLVSSAGALFEGQRHVTESRVPQPRRPYGRLKLFQEQLLQDVFAPANWRIYRVTSVYGYIRKRFRSGLVPTLVVDGMRRSVSHITARMATMRDFVFIDDVAAFIADRLLETDDCGTQMFYLAHGRPYSLLEVQRSVEAVLRRRLYVSYSVDPANAEHITFAPSIVPRAWYPSDLHTNVGLIYHDALTADMLAEKAGRP